MQVIDEYCDIKIDFADVAIEVEFEVTGECEDCLNVTAQRDIPLVDGEDVDYQVECYICGTSDPREYEITVNQGDQIDLCIDIENIANLDDACILWITEMFFLIGEDVSNPSPDAGNYDTYRLVYNGLAPQVPLVYPGITCDNTSLADGNPDGCSISMVPLAQDFQELESGATYTAKFTGEVLLGFGEDRCNDFLRRDLSDFNMRDLKDAELVEVTSPVVTITTPESRCAAKSGFRRMLCQFMELITRLLRRA
jgi:hypothetical protein